MNIDFLFPFFIGFFPQLSNCATSCVSFPKNIPLLPRTMQVPSMNSTAGSILLLDKPWNPGFLFLYSVFSRTSLCLPNTTDLFVSFSFI